MIKSKILTRSASDTQVSPREAETGSRFFPSHWRAGALRVIGRHGILLTLLLFIGLFSILNPDTFFTRGNLTAILGTQAILLMVALAVTMPLASGDFDLSVGFTLGFSMSLIAFLTVRQEWAWPPAMVVVILLGFAIGMVNGFFIVRLDVNAFIVTLGTGTVLSGLAIALTGGEVISGLPTTVESIARQRFFGLPLVTFYGFALAAGLWYVYDHTPFGRFLYFVGGGRDAARLAGLPVGKIRFTAFVFAAGVCGIAGVLYAGQLGAADATIGGTFLLPAYAAAFLGATTIKPGRFNSWGTVLALYLLATGITGLQLQGAPFWVEPVFNGTALTLAVTFARVASRERTD